MKKTVHKLLTFLILSFLWVPCVYAVTPEPVIEDYTNYPIFLAWLHKYINNINKLFGFGIRAHSLL